MSKSSPAPRRKRVERNIYRRPTDVFEVGFKDGAGVQRWRTVEGGITAARVLRDDLLARRGRGERVAPNPRLRFSEASEKWLSFRHTVASRALLAGESVDEIAFLLGHRDANVTRAVYVRELADTRRRAMRRTRMAAEFDGALRASANEDR